MTAVMVEAMGLVEGAILIFLARICDVSLGTVRIVLLARGRRLEASLIGFFESFLWIIVTAQIIRHLSSPLYYVAFAGGFACGNYVGLILESKLALGNVVIRVITRQDPDILIKTLRDEGFIVTTVDAEGRDGPVMIIFAVVERKRIERFLSIVHQCSPQSFYTIEDVREAKRALPIPKGGSSRLLDFLKKVFWPKRK